MIKQLIENWGSLSNKSVALANQKLVDWLNPESSDLGLYVALSCFDADGMLEYVPAGAFAVIANEAF